MQSVAVEVSIGFHGFQMANRMFYAEYSRFRTMELAIHLNFYGILFTNVVLFWKKNMRDCEADWLQVVKRTFTYRLPAQPSIYTYTFSDEICIRWLCLRRLAALLLVLFFVFPEKNTNKEAVARKRREYTNRHWICTNIGVWTRVT